MASTIAKNKSDLTTRKSTEAQMEELKQMKKTLVLGKFFTTLLILLCSIGITAFLGADYKMTIILVVVLLAYIVIEMGSYLIDRFTSQNKLSR